MPVLLSKCEILSDVHAANLVVRMGVVGAGRSNEPSGSNNGCSLPHLPGSESSEIVCELARCIQIRLLCVQDAPDDKPAMSAVVPTDLTRKLRSGSQVCGRHTETHHNHNRSHMKIEKWL